MRRSYTPAAEPAVPAVPVIAENGVYSADQVRILLRLRQSSLRREIREGRLRVCKRCGRYYFLGAQLLDWLRGGELQGGSGPRSSTGVPRPR
jgi:hypothetical protein